MGEAHNMYPNLNDQQQFRLNKINEVKDYFIAEIRESELMSERISKYIASFDYFDKPLIVLSPTNAGISIASYWSTCRNSKCKFYFYIFNNHKTCKKSC